MFKQTAGSVLIVMLSACTSTEETTHGSAIEFDVTSGVTTITCYGNERFEPVEGITSVLIRDMEDIADKSCGSGALERNVHLSSDINVGEAIVVKSAQVEFSCAGGAKISDTFTEQLTMLC